MLIHGQYKQEEIKQNNELERRKWKYMYKKKRIRLGKYMYKNSNATKLMKKTNRKVQLD